MRKKKRKGVQKKKLIDAPLESNIKTVSEEQVSSENRHFGVDVNDKVQSVVKEVVLPEVSKLNDLVMNKNPGD